MPTVRVKENEPFEVALCAASSAPSRRPAFSPSFARASSTKSRPPSASASSPPRSSATTSACAASCCRPSSSDTGQASSVRRRGEALAPFCFSSRCTRSPRSAPLMSLKSPHQRRLKTAMRGEGRAAPGRAAAAARRDQAARGRRAHGADRRRRGRDHRQDDQAAARFHRPVREGRQRQDLVDNERSEIAVLAGLHARRRCREAEIDAAIADAIARRARGARPTWAK